MDNRRKTNPKQRNNKFKRKFKRCFFMKNNMKYINYKDVELLKKFISNNGQILPKRVTGTSSKYQKKLATAIKRARQIGLLPFIVE